MDQLVPQLNEFDPALPWGYASVVALLADEQAAGRLQIRPTLIICAAEGLPPAEYAKIADTFGCPVRNLYGSTESGYATYGGAHGWLHLLPGWTILEPVDDDYQPTPPGVQSHTVLLTNLANRVQPVLRYDLGDSILIRPDRCRCGDPAPAIQGQGRAADVLTFPATNPDKESTVQVAPLAFDSLVDRVPAVTTFQIVHTAPTVYGSVWTPRPMPTRPLSDAGCCRRSRISSPATTSDTSPSTLTASHRNARPEGNSAPCFPTVLTSTSGSHSPANLL